MTFVIWRPFEPRFQGKRLSAWAEDLYVSGTLLDNGGIPSWQERNEVVQKHQKATEAIRHIGAKALPYALKLCQARDSALKTRIEDWLDAQNLVDFEFTSAVDKRLEGVYVFSALGPVAKPAIPFLILLLNDLSSGSTAALALYGIGPDSVDPLIEALGSRNVNTRKNAAYGLALLQARATPAIPALVRCLKDEVAEVRYSAARALGYIGEESDTVVPALIKCLESETNLSGSAQQIIMALGRFGTNSHAAVPMLVQIVETNRSLPERFIAGSALSSLRKIDPETAAALAEKLEAAEHQ